MSIVVIIVAAILTLAAAGTIYRIAAGPSLLDRVIAADVLLAIFGASLATEMAMNKHTDNLALLVVLTVIGFIGSVTVARFVAHRKEEG
ncbi:cation:proton antiporter [Arthrobacter glacialis]|uniref:Cation:proton antiporter n=2 Tax=Arthrobacter glacialis TaxID=1664 RepID=A0A2S4A2T9_ARTGL|nr:monovalent cation/H+ antiporter complex subunit F [Arthrobacter glacialis]POH61299.1 cation:proton antiporter [Arthrobacter glacialis]POH75437.1 cation:proton antiporter [Arthrobacter glacialis]